MLDICLLGTGGMMPLPHRWLTSLMARIHGKSILYKNYAVIVLRKCMSRIKNEGKGRWRVNG